MVIKVSTLNIFIFSISLIFIWFLCLLSCPHPESCDWWCEKHSQDIISYRSRHIYYVGQRTILRAEINWLENHQDSSETQLQRELSQDLVNKFCPRKTLQGESYKVLFPKFNNFTGLFRQNSRINWYWVDL